jgi:hypothetical protein
MVEMFSEGQKANLNEEI